MYDKPTIKKKKNVKFIGFVLFSRSLGSSRRVLFLFNNLIVEPVVFEWREMGGIGDDEGDSPCGFFFFRFVVVVGIFLISLLFFYFLFIFRTKKTSF